ncbi:transglycosylase SLT domain-containing protein [Spirosoma sp. BT702]|uniref:Transglycosylase SLT domain-containing protein n=2 Tax=Spirosoma profusum TaxID=2771354 RepID=A0A926XZ92_9BACT|nr:transglycosylase SLT domain-containing protein [Spirosoma profusum]
MLSLLTIATSTLAQKKSLRSTGKPKRQPGLIAPKPVSLTPQRLHFCGEIVPTEQGDVSAKLALALAGSSGYVRHVNSLKNRSAPYFTIIEPALRRHNIPNDFKYLPLIESAWKADAVSSAGAVGYWQFMDDTAQDMGLSITPGNDERTDLIKSTEAACKYLKFLYRKLGSWTLVAAAYNGGVGMVQRKISKTGNRDYYAMPMNAETGYYLYRILAMKELFTNPSYGLGAVGLMLASGDAYEREREQARRMGWLQDQEPELVGTPIESVDEKNPASRSEVTIMDSVLVGILKNRPVTPLVFPSDAVAKLVRAGLPKIGQSWTFALTEPIQIDEYELKPGDILYAVVDDIDGQNNLFLRATKAVLSETKTTIPLSLIAMNPATGLAGIPRPKVIKTGWIVQWKL